MDFKIVSDSSADVRGLDGIPFSSVALTIKTKEKEFVDNSELDVCDMLAYLEKYKGKSGSACPNVSDWIKAFSDAKNIFCITITSNLSGSYNSARLAAEKYMQENAGTRVYVIDSLSTGPECALIIERLKALILGGMEFEEIREKIEQYRKSTHLIFSLQSMRNLANNGRVSPIVAKIAGILGIRVVGCASLEGTLEITNKSRGVKNMYNDILENMKLNGFSGGNVRIHHCENEQGSIVLKEKILSLYPDASVRIFPTAALCSFYAERGGILIGYEGNASV